MGGHETCAPHGRGRNPAPPPLGARSHGAASPQPRTRAAPRPPGHPTCPALRGPGAQRAPPHPPQGPRRSRLPRPPRPGSDPQLPAAPAAPRSAGRSTTTSPHLPWPASELEEAFLELCEERRPPPPRPEPRNRPLHRRRLLAGARPRRRARRRRRPRPSRRRRQRPQPRALPARARLSRGPLQLAAGLPRTGAHRGGPGRRAQAATAGRPMPITFSRRLSAVKANSFISCEVASM